MCQPGRQGGFPWVEGDQGENVKGVSEGQVCDFIQGKVSGLGHVS